MIASDAALEMLICAEGWTCDQCGADNAVECKCPRSRPSNCWWNAQEALARLPAETRQHASYVEGWAVARRGDERVIFAHGWMEVDGHRRDDTPHNHAEEYFPARRLPAEDVIRFVVVPLCPPAELAENSPASYRRDHASFSNEYVEAEALAKKFCQEHQTEEQAKTSCDPGASALPRLLG